MSPETISTIDIQTSRLVLRDDLIFAPQRHRGETYYHLECKIDSKFYRICYSEYVFLSLLDGSRTLSQALALASQHLGAQALTTAEATEIYLWLLRNQLGKLVDQPNHGPLSATPPKPGSPDYRQATTPQVNPFWLKFSLVGGDGPRLTKRFDRWLGTCRWMFSPQGTLIGLSLMLVAIVALQFHWTLITRNAKIAFSPGNLLTMAVAWLILKFVHELGHAAVCRRYGVEINDAGIVFVLFAPMPYIDVTSAWRLPSKWQRIHIAAAGMFVELVVAAVAALALVQIGVGAISNTLFHVVLMASVSTVLFNANPLMRFDGYYLLSDLLEIPNLYSEATKRVQRRATWLFFGPWRRSPSAIKTNETDDHRWAYLGALECYGWLTVGWRILICASLALAASVLWHGAGVVLACIGMVMWVRPQLQRLVQTIHRRWSVDRRSLLRATLSLTVASGLLVGFWQYAPAPFPVSAPGVVEYADVVQLRSEFDAFVEDIQVDDGEMVRAGDLLLVLRNDDVALKYRELQLAMEQTQLREWIAIDQGDIPESRVQSKNNEALKRQFAQIRRQFEAQFVRAPIDGMVVRRGLANQIGSFVDEGSLLVSIGREQEKEVVVSVSHNDFDRVVDRVGSHVDVHLGGFTWLAGTLAKLEPRASTTLSAECLAANEGGPLAVESIPSDPNDRESIPAVQLVTPRFRGVVAISPDAAEALPCGQRVQMKVRNGTDRLGDWLFSSARSWIESKLKRADSG